MTPSPTASVPARGAGLAGVLEIARRRRVLAIVPFLLVLAAAASLAFFLPGLWTARSLIMVDRPQVPESMVKSTVVSDLEGQLISMSQEIMSRPRLAAIIQRYNLYPRVRQSFGMDEAVERMRKDIKLEIQGDPERRRGREPRTMMFSVAYSTSNPRIFCVCPPASVRITVILLGDAKSRKPPAIAIASRIVVVPRSSRTPGFWTSPSTDTRMLRTSVTATATSGLGRNSASAREILSRRCMAVSPD